MYDHNIPIELYVPTDHTTPSQPIPLWFKIAIYGPGFLLFASLGLFSLAQSVPSVSRFATALLLVGSAGMVLGIASLPGVALIQHLKAKWQAGIRR